MKISKLFHWLYAILMLLPVFFIGGRVFYTIFNKNAKDSFTETYTKYTQVNRQNLYRGDLVYFYSEKYEYDSNYSSATIYITDLDNFKSTSPTISLDTTQVNSLSVDRDTIAFFNGNVQLARLSLLTFNTSFTFNYQSAYNLSSFFANTSYLYHLEEIPLTLDNAFSYSVNQLNDNVLFSWAKDSFIVEPFRYITGLFGVPSDSPVLTLLSYWCSISLIWLTFDLLMYVPLLVHRWLDKGVLE